MIKEERDTGMCLNGHMIYYGGVMKCGIDEAYHLQATFLVPLQARLLISSKYLGRSIKSYPLGSDGAMEVVYWAREFQSSARYTTLTLF